MPPGPALDPYAVLQVLPSAEQEVVNAAYRALALKYHPDRDPSRRAAQRMGDLNRAYELVRTASARAAFDRGRRRLSNPVAPPPPSPMRPSAARPASAPTSSVLGFGRYTGWSLRDLARQDPDYILWLSRHSSGIRYRTEIYGILRTIGVSAA